MSLQSCALELILREHKRSPAAGDVLTLGRQFVHASYGQVVRLFRRFEVEPHAHVPVTPPKDETEPIDAALFFRMLGYPETYVLDLPSELQPDLVADLNDPVPEHYHNRFGLVLDGGTLEHVFDLRQGFVNVASMAAPGGRTMHFNPVNNHVNHGFVQLSPTAFFDYYEANGFVATSADIIMYSQEHMGTEAWSTFEYDRSLMGGLNSMFCSADTMLSIFFVATKTAASTVDALPIQAYFLQSFDEKCRTTPAFRLEYNKQSARSSTVLRVR